MVHPRPSRRARGFTILELLVAAFIALIIFAIGLMVLNSATAARSAAQQRIRASDSARMFFEELERDLAGAYTGICRRGDLVQKLAGTADQYFIQVCTTTEDRNPGTEWQLVQYYVLADGKLYRKMLPGALHMSFTSPDSNPATNSDYALCPDVRGLSVSFMQWQESTKTYLPAADAKTATHLEVGLTCKGANDKDPGRTYWKYLRIPDTVTP